MSTKKKRETIPQPFQKVLNLKLGNPNIFLVYSLLMKSGIVSDQNNSKDDKDLGLQGYQHMHYLLYKCETQQISYL